MSAARVPGSDVALVLIHGIGDITPGGVLGVATEAVTARLEVEEVAPVEELHLAPRDAGDGGAHASLWRSVVPWDGQRIDLIEFNWTSVTEKIRLRRPLDALVKLFGVLGELPALGTIGRARPVDRVVLTGTAWVLQLALLVFLFTVPVMVGSEFRWRDEYAARLAALPPTTPSAEALAEDSPEASALIEEFELHDSALAGAILTVWKYTFFALLSLPWVMALFSCVRALVGFELRRALLALVAALLGLVLALAGCGAVLAVGVWSFQLGLFLLEPEAGPLELAFGLSFVGLFAWFVARAAIGGANLLRDVVHYLAPDPHGELRPHQRAIRAELWQLIESLQDERRFARIVLVAHSLGTVILVDLLKEHARTPRAERLPLDLVTAGSPLRRLIHRLFPDRTPKLVAVRRELADTPGLTVARWFNVYRIADYVGQALTSTVLLCDVPRLRWEHGDPEAGIRDKLLRPIWRWPFGHANYWADGRFLAFVAEEVVRPLRGGAQESS